MKKIFDTKIADFTPLSKKDLPTVAEEHWEIDYCFPDNVLFDRDVTCTGIYVTNLYY